MCIGNWQSFLVYPDNYPTLAVDNELLKLFGIFADGKAKLLLVLLNLFTMLSEAPLDDFSITVLCDLPFAMKNNVHEKKTINS